jgi:hypothetical protein
MILWAVMYNYQSHHPQNLINALMMVEMNNMKMTNKMRITKTDIRMGMSQISSKETQAMESTNNNQ